MPQPPYYTADALDPDRSVGYLIKRCGVLMTLIAEHAFGTQPISFVQWMILMWLNKRPHGSPTELSAYVGHDMGALTRVVDTMELAGLVRRERSQHDRRAVEIAITPEGRRLNHVGKQVIVDMLNKLVEPYSKTEVDGLITLLQRLLARMQQCHQAQSQTQAPATADASFAPPADADEPEPHRPRPTRRSKQQAPAPAMRPHTTAARATRKAPRRKSKE